MGANDWFDAIDARNDRISAILSNPAAIALARRRARNGRVPDIPILCGTHETGYFISLSLEDEVLAATYRAAIGAPALTGIAHVDDLLPPFEAQCAECGARLRRSSAWVVEEAVKALGMQRAVVRARRT